MYRVKKEGKKSAGYTEREIIFKPLVQKRRPPVSRATTMNMQRHPKLEHTSTLLLPRQIGGLKTGDETV